MYKEDLYIVAYERIKSKPGNMTPGTDGATLDGWSLQTIQKIIEEMRNEQFQFKPVRTEYIPKPNSNKMRKLGIPSTRDKVVQEVMRMILEAIYDSPYGPYFHDTSHGFRRNRSCHTALREIRGKWAATNWFVEGDIQACFDEIDHHILVGLLHQKIKDRRFLNLIWKLLRAGYFDMRGQRQDSLAGTPQGGIVSPLLMNVYLHELDNKVEELRQQHTSGKRKQRNPLYRKLATRKERLARQGQTKTKEFRELVQQIRATPSINIHDPNFIRIKYARYADDWLIGICGPRTLAEKVKEEIRMFLAEDLHLTLSENKTRITHARSEQAHFLGTLISISRGGNQRVTKVTNGHKKPMKRRTTGSEVVMKLPVKHIMLRLHNRGFCTTTGESTTKLGWTNLDPEQIVSLYNGTNRGIQNYYRFVDNITSLARIQHILRFSLARTLAAKYKISVKQVFGRFGRNTTIIVNARDGKRDRRVSFYLNSDWKMKRNTFKTNDEKVDLVRMAIRMRSRSNLGKPCCICGSPQQVEMHHVRHIRKRKGKKATGFKAIMSTLNRKQIPACKSCHRKIHRGDYDGISLKKLAYDPR
jgi:group II intron reverse transcriptase/maturase